MNKLLFTWLLLMCCITSATALEPVTIQLKWKHGFQFAGYYAAKAKGFYADEGIDVSFKERIIGGKHYIDIVADNDAEYGVTDTALLRSFEKGKPLVLLKQIFQHSPLVLITLKSSGIISPYELAGKRVASDLYNVGNAQLHMMIQDTLGHMNKDIVVMRPTYDYNRLINKEVDAIAGYATDQPYWFKSKGIDINIINPQSYGIDFYGDNFFTNTTELENHPNRVDRMIRATLKGWKYALNHPDEIINLILDQYNTRDLTRDHLTYEANTTAQMIAKEFIPLGLTEKKRFSRILGIYKHLGLSNLSSIPDAFIYQSNTHQVQLTNAEKQWLKKQPAIKLGVPTEHEPAIFVDQHQQISGIIPDYFDFFSKQLNHKIELVPYESGKQNAYQFASDRQLHGNSIAFRSPINNVQYLLTSPYMFSHFHFFSGKDTVDQYQTPADLKGKKVGVLKYNDSAIAYLKRVGGVKIVQLETSLKMMDKLQSNEIDVIMAYAGFHYQLNKHMFSNIHLAFSTDKPQSISIGVFPTHSQLQSIMNKAIPLLDEETRQQIIQKWMGSKRISPVISGDVSTNTRMASLTSKEKQFLTDMKQINMCIDPNWMPYEKFENGRHIGMSADFINIISNKIQTPIKPVFTKTWPESLEFGKQRKCDIFSLIMPTETRKSFLNFTEPYLESPLVIVTNMDELFIDQISNITDKTIGIVEGYAYAEILRKRYPQMQIVDVPNIDEGLRMVKDGKLFGFIETLATVGYRLQSSYLGQLKIAGKFDEIWSLGIGTRNDMPQLNSIFNKAIAAIPEDQRQKIINQWISVKYEKGADYALVLKVALGLLLIIVFFIYRNFSINKLNQKLMITHKELESKNILIQQQTSELLEQKKMVDQHILMSSTDLKGVITSVNEAFCRISGYSEEELIGKNHNIIRHPDMPKELYKDMWDTIQVNQHWSGELKNLSKTGEHFWVTVMITPIFDESGEKVGYRSIRENITDKKRIEELSITDRLTGLYNRLMLDEVFEQKMHEFDRHKIPFSIILLDIDHFKAVNDTFGHDVGDTVLIELANILTNELRESDIAGRWGGEEFVIICNNTHIDGAYILAEKIRQTVESHSFKTAGYKTISLGVVEFKKGHTIASLFKKVDQLLYLAKQNGRNQTKI